MHRVTTLFTSPGRAVLVIATPDGRTVRHELDGDFLVRVEGEAGLRAETVANGKAGIQLNRSHGEKGLAKVAQKRKAGKRAGNVIKLTR